MTITWFFTPAIALLFLQTPDEALIALMRQFLLIVGVFSWTLGLVNGFRFSIQGMGYAQLAILSGVTEMAARVGVALVLVPWLAMSEPAWAPRWRGCWPTASWSPRPCGACCGCGSESPRMRRRFKASPHNCVCGLRPIFCPIRAVIKGGNTYSIPALL